MKKKWQVQLHYQCYGIKLKKLNNHLSFKYKFMIKPEQAKHHTITYSISNTASNTVSHS